VDQVETAQAALELVELVGLVDRLVVVGVEILLLLRLEVVMRVAQLAVVVGQVVVDEVAAVLLGLRVEPVRVGVGARVRVVYHHVLAGLLHRVGEQPLYLEGLLDQDVLNIV
jgi:hypothetical protein